MHRELVPLVRGAQMIQISVVRVLEYVRCENCGDQCSGCPNRETVGRTFYPDSDVDGQVKDKSKQPVSKPHSARA